MTWLLLVMGIFLWLGLRPAISSRAALRLGLLASIGVLAVVYLGLGQTQ